MGVIGVLYLLGLKKGSKANVIEMWKRDGTGFMMLRAAFSYKRFLFLLRSIWFDDKRTRKDRKKDDKIAATREFYTNFVSNCQKNYNLSEFVTIVKFYTHFKVDVHLFNICHQSLQNTASNCTHYVTAEHFTCTILDFTVENKRTANILHQINRWTW